MTWTTTHGNNNKTRTMSLKLESKAIKAAVPQLKFRTQAFIDGKFVNAASGQTYVSINPATGKPLAKIASCEARMWTAP